MAGRTALLQRLPPGLEEVRRFPNPPTDLFELLWRGSYPASYGRQLEPADWYPSYDSGLVCWLLGIRSPDQLRNHPLRGAIVESWVASELAKARLHRGLLPALSLYRDRSGTEVDLVLQLGRSWMAAEAKSGQTVADDFFSGLRAFGQLAASGRGRREVAGFVVYGGSEARRRDGGTVVPWAQLDRCRWWETGE